MININNRVYKSENRYDIPLATAEQINKIIKTLNPNKATNRSRQNSAKISNFINKYNRLSFSKYH